MPATPSLNVLLRPGCLVVQLHNRDILENKALTVQAIAEALKVHGLRSALIDCRDVMGAVSFMDRFQLGILAGRYLSGFLIGVLARPEQADPQRIGQLVARNRGTEVEVFTNPVEADAWVQQHAQKS